LLCKIAIIFDLGNPRNLISNYTILRAFNPIEDKVVYDFMVFQQLQSAVVVKKYLI